MTWRPDWTWNALPVALGVVTVFLLLGVALGGWASLAKGMGIWFMCLCLGDGIGEESVCRLCKKR